MTHQGVTAATVVALGALLSALEEAGNLVTAILEGLLAPPATPPAPAP